MIAQYASIKNKILDVKYGRVKEGLGIGIQGIDEYLRYKQGNFNLLIGHANTGKTTIICYLFVVWAIKHDLKFLIWSSENTPQSIVRKIIEFKMNKPIQKSSDDEISEAMNWCDKHFKIIDVEDLYNYQQLIKEADAIKQAWNYDALLVDPYNSLSKDYTLLKVVGGHEYDYQVASEFRMFAKKNNITIYLNAHGVTEALRKTHPANHEYANLSKPLSMADVEGGGKWGNRADDVICIHRYTSHSSEWMYSNLYVLKVKENETGGRPTPYEEPIRLKMKINNTGFEFMNKDILKTKNNKKLVF